MADTDPQPAKRERLVYPGPAQGPFDLPTVRAGRVKIKLEPIEDTDDGTDWETPQANEPGGGKVVA